jgi:hypothetical protein
MSAQPKNDFLEAWMDRGRELAKHGKHLANQEDCRQWDIGDWLTVGEDDGVKKKVLKLRAFKKHAMEITKYKSWGSLKNLMTTARNVPESRRRDGRKGRKFLSYATHAEAAKFDEKQEWLLEQADNGNPRCGMHRDGTHPPYSVREFKKFIVRMQEQGDLPKTGVKRKKLSPKGQKLQVWVSEAHYEFLNHLSLALGPPYSRQPKSDSYSPIDEPLPEAALLWCAEQYAKENKTVLKAKIAADQVERTARKRIQEICNGKLEPSAVSQ